jgi:hypothetical protein
VPAVQVKIEDELDQIAVLALEGAVARLDAGLAAREIAIAGGTVTAGDELSANGSGTLITATGTNTRVIALAMESAVSSDLLPVLQIPAGRILA